MKKRYSFSSSLITVIAILYMVASEIWEGLKINFEYFLPFIAVTSVYSNIKDFSTSKKSSSNSITFKTKNDHYYKFSNYFWGIGILIGVITWYFYFEWTLLIVLSLLILGISLIVSGIQNTPSGTIKINREEVIFGDNHRHQYIALDRLHSIKIMDESIVVKDLDDKQYSINHLRLNSNNIQNLKSFIRSKLGDALLEK